MHVDVLRVDPEDLCRHVGEDGIRSLADVGGAAENGDAAAAVSAGDDARVRHVVPVDRRAGAREVRGAGDADSLLGTPPDAPAEPIPFLAPASALADLVDAFSRPHL